MQEDNKPRNFWLGNGILAVAFVILLYMGALWERMGVMAMVLWVVVAGVGAYFLMGDSRTPKDPD